MDRGPSYPFYFVLEILWIKYMLHKRPSMSEIFMGVAILMSKRSTCSAKIQVGAVLVTPDYRIVATGYNGSPSGFPHCDEVGCDDNGHTHRVIHAEENAILQCARNGVKTVGLSIYCTHMPCERCAARLIQAGIKRVYYCTPNSESEVQHRSEKIFRFAEVYLKKEENDELLRIS